jgi:hypothetical protein
MIEQLFGADAAYQDDLDYDFFPGRRVESEGNNSNSYASGLLRAVGFQNFGRPPNTPGFNLPVTTGNFKKATVEVTECSTEPGKCGS